MKSKSISLYLLTYLILCCIVYTDSTSLAEENEISQDLIIKQLKDKIAGLDKQIESLKEENSRLNTLLSVHVQSEDKFGAAITAIKKNDYEGAQKLLSDLINDNPNSKYMEEIKNKLAFVNKKLKQINKEQEEKKKVVANGFNNIKTFSTIKTDNTKLEVKKAIKAKKWISDWHGNEYLYEDADKNSDFITIDFNITSNNKDPQLPALYVGEVSQNGTLENIKLFNVAFYGWSDYGSFLGNYHDSKNDFAKKDTVRFSAGVQMEKGNKQKIIFTNKNECYSRINRDLPPAATYSGYSCPEIKSPLKIDDFVDKFQAIKIIK